MSSVHVKVSDEIAIFEGRGEVNYDEHRASCSERYSLRVEFSAALATK